MSYVQWASHAMDMRRLFSLLFAKEKEGRERQAGNGRLETAHVLRPPSLPPPVARLSLPPFLSLREKAFFF